MYLPSDAKILSDNDEIPDATKEAAGSITLPVAADAAAEMVLEASTVAVASSVETVASVVAASVTEALVEASLAVAFVIVASVAEAGSVVSG